jgi:predicted AAA+ superfamily ATPase
MIARSVQPFVERDLENKIVLLSGTRQVGKTFLSRALFQGSQTYLNFDQPKNRAILREQSWDRQSALLVLNEIHKWRDWKR